MYYFSKYVIDPNRFRFRKVVRILGRVLPFINNPCKKHKGKSTVNYRNPSVKFPGGMSCLGKAMGGQYILTTGSACKKVPLKCIGGKVVCLSQEDINNAMHYFYCKATEEIKHFYDKQKYQNISEEVDGILFYSGRILPSQRIENMNELSDVSFDLTSTSFCVPLTDHLSPIAYAIAMEMHWYHADVKHGGLESVLRQTQRVAYILGDRKLIKAIGKDCTKCRILNKDKVKVAMGPCAVVNLQIAPAFYTCLVDLFGPFDSYSNINKRATTKVWFVVFFCCATAATDIKLMEDHSTDSFLLAFTRFACRADTPSC